jgi:DNA replication protein DnaC
MNDRLLTMLKQLRLSRLAETLDSRLQEAQGHLLGHDEFLELILQDEVLTRQERTIARRVKSAAFRELKSLDNFDWSFNPSIQRKKLFDLATFRVIRETRDVLLLGPPGVGKSFLVQARGYQAIKQGFAMYYRSIFVDVTPDELQRLMHRDGVTFAVSFDDSPPDEQGLLRLTLAMVA